MNKSTEFLILDTIRKNSSLMPLFTSGYSYSKVMEWSRILEQEGKIEYSELGYRVLTKKGNMIWENLKKKQGEFIILPLQEYKVHQLEIDEIYLP